ncbi:MAG: type II toxin-antitoxin system RelE/ParE family toxin [Cyanobacteria bacterium P01_D01_bin.36]
MTWTIEFHEAFAEEVVVLDQSVKKQLAVSIKFLEEFGPQLKRPYADTLKGSSYSNMKELRFNSNDGVWRIAYAFDPDRKAILLVGGDKSGVSQKRFYKSLIKKADERFAQYLSELDRK